MRINIIHAHKIIQFNILSLTVDELPSAVRTKVAIRKVLPTLCARLHNFLL